MNDLISRKAAIEAVKRLSIGETDAMRLAIRIVDYLERLASTQLEIIRCKDCKYWDTTWESDYAPNYHFCPMLGRMSEGDFYCADAERRTDE